MSYNRAYTQGEWVRVDAYAPGINPLPTLGNCTIPAVVLTASVAAEVQVYIAPEGYVPLYVYKDRVTP